MRHSPENPILVGERFLIRDARVLKPIIANVIKVESIKGEDEIWQRIGLKRVTPPLTSFEMSTARRIGSGVYWNRDGRYTFLRTSILELEEMSKFFNNGARQLAKELIRDLLGHDLRMNVTGV